MRDLATGLGLVLVVEGLAWAVAPAAMKRAARRVLEIAEGPLRLTGLVVAAAGVFAVWLVRG
ncbi:MAG: hypothetical protein KatS3mg117_1383 [Geminicoccaceae bacterium]|nr:MAG: hypothetical protein KatS3mg117_1383 [Geminicoccaceae bacterium]